MISKNIMISKNEQVQRLLKCLVEDMEGFNYKIPPFQAIKILLDDRGQYRCIIRQCITLLEEIEEEDDKK